MRILGRQVPFTRKPTDEKALQPVSAGSRGGVWSLFGVIAESFTGAWQQNVEIRTEDILRHPAVQAVLALLSGDVGKLNLRLMKRTGGIWVEQYPAANPIFNKPNRYQTRVQFFEQWVLSLLIWGNVYVLKERDREGKIIAYHILDPRNVIVLVSDDGQVFYDLRRDNLAGLEVEHVAVPAVEIIHDRYKPKYHPLVGCSPLEACALAAAQGIAIQNNATVFFRNGSRPGGILTAPGPITQETAATLKATWDTNFKGENFGKVAVLGDGLKYEAAAVTASDAEMTDQLKLTNEMVGMAFLVPLWKFNAGQMPAYGNVQSANVDYYSTCIQTLLENIEALLDEGLELGPDLHCEFDTDGLMRMDMVSLLDALDKGKNIMQPDEQRKRLNLPPVPGGDAVYRQQQDYSLAALEKRDARDDPFSKEAGTVVNVSGGTDGGASGEPVADVQASAFNGAQVTALLDIIAAVTGGVMPPESAKAAIAAAFPALTPEEINAIIDPLAEFEAKPPANDNPDDAKMTEALDVMRREFA